MARLEPCVVVDRTHLGGRASGIERITRDLFSDECLAPLPVRGTAQCSGRGTTVLHQLLYNPLNALRFPRTVWIFSGFPPSPLFRYFTDRSVFYVHDLFLMDRPGDLNSAARLYLAPNFRAALRDFQFFLTNSMTTADRLRARVGLEATVLPYRPPARDVFGLAQVCPLPHGVSDPVRIGMIGTIEPRKNYAAAVALRRTLETQLARPVELHIVGREGWGPDWEMLAKTPGVHLHGFVDDRRMGDVVRQWTLFLSTSHDEGLGLPLLEVQHAGLPIVAPDCPVFREVLGESGVFIDPADPESSAVTIAGVITDTRHGSRLREAGRVNLERWNGLAADDHAAVIDLLRGLLAKARNIDAASVG